MKTTVQLTVDKEAKEKAMPLIKKMRSSMSREMNELFYRIIEKEKEIIA